MGAFLPLGRFWPIWGPPALAKDGGRRRRPNIQQKSDAVTRHPALENIYRYGKHYVFELNGPPDGPYPRVFLPHLDTADVGEVRRALAAGGYPNI